jgi:putative Ca2+/H+ antiporter (TMEM165/GDT1 family)
MNWSLLLSTFSLVFLAELGDKTQLAVVTQTCKYRSPWSVFLGGSLALIVVTALGAVGGQILGRLIPDGVIQVTAGLAFVIMGLVTWRESTRICDNGNNGTSEIDCEEGIDSQAGAERKSPWNWKAFSSTLSLLFLAELGDKTQLAVIGLSSEQSTPWVVFLGGALALSSVTALGVIGGQQLCKIIPQRILLKIAALLFLGMGLWMGFKIL